MQGSAEIIIFALYFFHVVPFTVCSKVMNVFHSDILNWIYRREIFGFVFFFCLFFKHWIRKIQLVSTNLFSSSNLSYFATVQIDFLLCRLLLAKKKKKSICRCRYYPKNCCLLIFSNHNPCSKECYIGQQKTWHLL